MADASTPSEEVRLISESPRISAVGNDRIRIEFQIDDLVSQLMRQAPSRIIVASCGGCNGCSGSTA